MISVLLYAICMLRIIRRRQFCKSSYTQKCELRIITSALKNIVNQLAALNGGQPTVLD